MASSRDVSTLPLAGPVVSLLQTAGFRYVSDLVGLQPTDLSREIGCPLDTAVQVLRCVAESTANQNAHPNHAPTSSSSGASGSSSSSGHGGGVGGPKVMTAKALVEAAGARRPIITYSKAMDTVLGGGVVCGQLTEFCGPPGVGKTQICIQLAVDVQLPPHIAGLGGEAVYIDTEGRYTGLRDSPYSGHLP
jgi:RAD51-like protein 2